MTFWAQLLHFYQPPTQTHEVLRKVADESYRPLLAVLKEHPQARIAININGVLTEMLHEHGLHDIIDDLRELGERGQVEFVGTGKYHPILPLIPAGERTRSIAEHAQANRSLLGADGVRGFFPPELCYAGEILPEVAAAGFEWLILSGVGCPGPWPTAAIPRVLVNGRTLRVLFRDDVRSNRISFRETSAETFIEELRRLGEGGEAYVFTAMDAETFGHHIAGWEREFLASTYRQIEAAKQGPGPWPVQMVQPSELLSAFPDGPNIEPLASSWSTSRDDIAALNPYPLWRAPGNRIHELQWEYTEHCLDIVAVARRYARTGDDARRYAKMAGDALQPALHSCQFWWASQRPMWDVSMIQRGFALLNDALLYAVKSVHESEAPAQVKRQVAWRLAAADDTRSRLERAIFIEGPP
jgi:predicted glycosyl hydrolase (DUF1957 family)